MTEVMASFTKNDPHSTSSNPTSTGGMVNGGFSCVLVCDYRAANIPTLEDTETSISITNKEVIEMIMKGANFRFIPQYCEPGVKPKPQPTNSVLYDLAEAVATCDRQILNRKSEYTGYGEGTGGLSMSGSCMKIGNAAISNFAGDTTKPALNKYLLPAYEKFASENKSLFEPDVELTEDDVKRIFDLNKEAKDKVLADYAKRNSTAEVGNGWNKTVYPKEGHFTEDEIVAALAAIVHSNTDDPDLQPSAKATLKWMEEYENVKVLDSFRGSIDLRERGRLLARQFGSLPLSLQRKLLQDDCFTKSHIARIQMYANWVPFERVTLDMHQDGVPTNTVYRLVHTCKMVI